MSDRELLEMAAKAFWSSEIDDTCSVHWIEGIECIGFTHADNQDYNGTDREFLWNPLAYDGDALRLAVKLRLNVELTARTVLCATDGADPSEAILDLLLDDPYASTRRVIVRAAAEIGKGMP